MFSQELELFSRKVGVSMFDSTSTKRCMKSNTNRRILGYVTTILLIGGTGCSRLVVQKITPECRNTSRDYNTKGFRYYLARPYVIVKEPIVVSVNRRLEPVPYAYFENNDKTQKGAACSESDCKEPALTCQELVAIRELLKNPNTTGSGTGGGGKDASGVKDTSGGGGSSDSVEFFDISSSEVVAASQLKGKIEIQFLPDLDEHYAVHHRNIAAIGSHKLIFKDGWQLVSVDGSFDSTTVAEELIKTIDMAIKASKGAGTNPTTSGSASSTEKTGGSGSNSREDIKTLATNDKHVILSVITTKTIPPGVYRINKPWEVTDGSVCMGAGFLSHLGLEMISTVEYELAEHP